jgi:hypothetical protein
LVPANSAFLGACPADALGVMLIAKDGRLCLRAADDQPASESGDNLIHDSPEHSVEQSIVKPVGQAG